LIIICNTCVTNYNQLYNSYIVEWEITTNNYVTVILCLLGYKYLLLKYVERLRRRSVIITKL